MTLSFVGRYLIASLWVDVELSKALAFKHYWFVNGAIH